ncbi:hypothetical protein K435DRAFT_860938 [Dendrothele bispora CBS 962.96]|uniref:Uncharacterized protein n=1 Tax=Dendrothele bispora (strain CBS 962.96) TaxID=1314807 RepID=A0A4S8LWN6_DENBC|nr:hypothetical protein K435DRAFT_860938 [Dendrothele bispora CBS 962.96]
MPRFNGSASYFTPGNTRLVEVNHQNPNVNAQITLGLFCPFRGHLILFITWRHGGAVAFPNAGQLVSLEATTLYNLGHAWQGLPQNPPIPVNPFVVPPPILPVAAGVYILHYPWRYRIRLRPAAILAGFTGFTTYHAKTGAPKHFTGFDLLVQIQDSMLRSLTLETVPSLARNPNLVNAPKRTFHFSWSTKFVAGALKWAASVENQLGINNETRVTIPLDPSPRRFSSYLHS